MSVSLGRCFEERESDVTLSSEGGLGWAWLAPLITGVMKSGSSEGGDSFSNQQAVIAGQRAAAQAKSTAASIGLIVGGVLIFGLGGWAVYRLTKD